MKRILSLGMALVMSCSLLTACGPKEIPSSSAGSSQLDVSISKPDQSNPVQGDVSTPVQPQPELPAEQSMTLNKADFTLKTAGASYKLKATFTGVQPSGVEWSSSDEAVATVDENGVVTAVSAGTATITATAGELTATCVVRCTIKEDKPVSGDADVSAPDQSQPEQPQPEQTPDLPAPDQSQPETPAPQQPSADALTERFVNALTNCGSEGVAYNTIYASPEGDGPLALEMMGLAPQDVKSFALTFSMMNMQAFGIAIVMPQDGCQQAVTDGLNGYIARMQQQFQRYLPDQYEITLNAKLAVLSDGTVVMVMCDGQDAVLQNIKSALG